MASFEEILEKTLKGGTRIDRWNLIATKSWRPVLSENHIRTYR